MSRTRKRLIGGLAAVVTAAAAILVGIVMVAGPAAAAGTGTGYLRTSGNKIVDSTGATVRLTGINWFGMETDNKTFHGLWANRSWQSHIDQMAELGYNTIRVPFSNDALRPDAVATSINTASNPDLLGLSPLEILDRVIDYAGSKGMRIILDRHRPTAAGQSALWYTAAVSEATMISDWQMLAERYAGNTTVIGADLHNEPHAEGTDPNGTGAGWGTGNTANDWRLAAERVGNAILSVQPNWLIFVEGVSCPSGGNANAWDNIPDEPCGWWGGNLSKVRDFGVRLSVANRLVYSPHEYAISVFHQDWFDDPSYPANLPGIWDSFWGYIYKENIAPIMLGEFGSTLQDPKDRTWLTNLMAYLGTGVDGMSFTYWSWNPNSGDTGGILNDDWMTVNQTKQSILQPYLIAPVGGSPGPSGPAGTSSCTMLYTLENEWTSGFQASVRFTNSGTTAVNNWQATWTVPSGVTLGNGWGATVTQSGTTITAAAPSHAATLAPGASVTIGFTADGPSSPAPTAFALNGTACA